MCVPYNLHYIEHIKKVIKKVMPTARLESDMVIKQIFKKLQKMPSPQESTMQWHIWRSSALSV